MSTVTLEEAQARLPELIARLAPGEELIITRDAQPVARLVGESEWVELEIPVSESLAQGLADDPTFDDWQAIIAENRRKEDEALGIYPERNPMPLSKK